MASAYFETITSKHALRKHAATRGKRLEYKSSSPAAVVVHYVCGGVLTYRISRSSSSFLKPPLKQSNAELSKIITPLQPGDESLTESELIHRLGGPKAADSNAQANSDVSDLKIPDLDDNDLPPPLSARPQQTRRQTQQHLDYVNSSKIKVVSSSPTSDLYPSSSFASDNAGHVSREEHAAWAVSEDATVQLASTFLRHALVHCPPQHVAAVGTPLRLLLEFSGIRRRMLAHFGDGALELEATADGEAKKRFKLVHEGRPVITDNVLGKMVGEVLTLRLSLAATESGYFEDTIVVVAAARQYLCFISFHIPDAYVKELQKEREDDDDDDGETVYEGDEEKRGEEEEVFITLKKRGALAIGEMKSHLRLSRAMSDVLDPALHHGLDRPLEIEARAALHLLDHRNRGHFFLARGDDYIFLAGDMCGHNIVISTLTAGQEYGAGSAAALTSQVKKFFPWLGLQGLYAKCPYKRSGPMV
ncbi:hypothetical protein B0T16DRAFT_499757 [Cercophora newfieldiana]|uniref:Uncharacterized protein n=1 Tax=Cercophora newfieldiana TaxID=92897 RepID=A0AA40CY49_9PEZI|nr:hypothetical protein B0T16DRAFT_499757 [Cercophora newfieldiana]